MSLTVLDRPLGAPPSAPAAVVWRTCLREVMFGEDAEGPWAASAEAITGGAAYARVLEIICGLRSPLVGETQVLGQFKTFIASLGPEHRWLADIGQRLLTDARAIRNRHLHHLGSRTYGSAVRRYVAGCDRVALVGGGALADELLPFLVEGRRQVDQWTRRPIALTRAIAVANPLIGAWTGIAVDAISTAALVVAAPIAEEDVARIASRYARLVRVVDLRAEAAAPAEPPLAPHVVTLQQVFARLAEDEATTAAQVSAARAEIAARSRAFDRAELIRPFGWDDLCA